MVVGPATCSAVWTALAIAISGGAGIAERTPPTPLPSQAPTVAAEDAGRARRMTALVARFTDAHVEARTSERFLLVGDLAGDAADAALARLERTADAVERFAREIDPAPPSLGRRATERFVVLAFAERAAFETFAKNEDRIDGRWMVGYWMPGADRVVVRSATAEERAVGGVDASRRGRALAATLEDDAATIAHEAAHQMLHRLGVQRRSLQSPLFLSEGLAMAFETCAAPGGEPFADQPARRTRLGEAMERSEVPSLHDIVSAARLPASDAEVERFYDASWSLVRHLRLERPQALERYVRAVRDAAPALSPARNVELFRRMVGDLAEVERSWRRSVLRAVHDKRR